MDDNSPQRYTGYRGDHPPLFDKPYDELSPAMQLAMRQCARLLAESLYECFPESLEALRARVKKERELADYYESVYGKSH